MTEVRRFVADLAMTGISFREIKELQEKRWGDLALKKTQIYAIIKKVKAGENASVHRRQRELLLLSPLSPPPSKKTAVLLSDLSSLLLGSPP